MKAAVYSARGVKGADITLDSAVFGVKPNSEMLALAYRRHLANQRSARAKTKTRGLVRGGGKKPWRQKGTGKARTGSIRNPLWRGGGTIFGPTGRENYSLTMPKRAVRRALTQALSAKTDHLIIIDKLQLPGIKTAAAVELLAKLKAEGLVLIIAAEKNQNFARSIANIPGVSFITAHEANVFDVLNSDTLIIEKAAVEELKQWLGSK